MTHYFPVRSRVDNETEDDALGETELRVLHILPRNPEIGITCVMNIFFKKYFMVIWGYKCAISYRHYRVASITGAHCDHQSIRSSLAAPHMANAAAAATANATALGLPPQAAAIGRSASPRSRSENNMARVRYFYGYGSCGVRCSMITVVVSHDLRRLKQQLLCVFLGVMF